MTVYFWHIVNDHLIYKVIIYYVTCDNDNTLSMSLCADIFVVITKSCVFCFFFYLLQVEDCSRDALHSVHCVFGVCRLLALHHHVLVQVELPLDSWVIRLWHQNVKVNKIIQSNSTRYLLKY